MIMTIQCLTPEYIALTDLYLAIYNVVVQLLSQNLTYTVTYVNIIFHNVPK